ncbi:MAG: TRAM domain-containing protein, partial [Ruminococcus sp.]|nr:TRAM domain-containing protein [Ruminococcus sp.]
MLEKNQFVTAEITDITSDGNGVCKVDGMAVFVPDTAVGDIVEIKIVKVLKKYAYGIISRISESSPDRIKADCPVYKQCGGCTFRHMNYESECRIKANIVENAFRRIGGRNPKFEKFISADKINEYRNKAQYPVTSVNGKVVCGFYAERSHRVIPITDCMLQPKVFSEILETVLEYINSKKISAYSEETNTGIMRHIYIRKGTYSDEIMLCFVVR